MRGGGRYLLTGREYSVDISNPYGLVDDGILQGCQCPQLSKTGEYTIVIRFYDEESGKWALYQLYYARPTDDGVRVGDSDVMENSVTFSGCALDVDCGNTVGLMPLPGLPPGAASLLDISDVDGGLSFGDPIEVVENRPLPEMRPRLLGRIEMVIGGGHRIPVFNYDFQSHELIPLVHAHRKLISVGVLGKAEILQGAVVADEVGMRSGSMFSNGGNFVSTEAAGSLEFSFQGSRWAVIQPWGAVFAPRWFLSGVSHTDLEFRIGAYFAISEEGVRAHSFAVGDKEF